MSDPVLRRLGRLATRLEKAREARDAAIREARKTHAPTAIAKAVRLSKARVIQIAKGKEKE